MIALRISIGEIILRVRDIIFYHGISLHVEYVIVCHKDERNVETELSKQI